MIVDPEIILYIFLILILFIFCNMFVLNYIELKVSSRIERRLGMINEFVFLRNIIFKFLRDISKSKNRDESIYGSFHFFFSPIILLLNILQILFLRSALKNNNISIIIFLLIFLSVIIFQILNRISINQKDKIYTILMNIVLKLVYLVPLAITFLYMFKKNKSYYLNIFLSKQIHQWYVFKDPVGFIICFISLLILTENIRFFLPSIKNNIVNEGYFSELSNALSKFIFCSIVVFVFFGGAKDLTIKMLVIPSEIVLIIKTYILMFFVILLKNSLPVFSFRQLFDFLYKFLIPITITKYVITIII